MRAILLMLSLPIFMLPVDACFSSIFGRSNDETTKNARAEHEKDGKITMSREDASKLYLQKYGYLRGLRVVVGDKTEEVAITDDEMKKALSMFQEFIGLEANGLLSNETVEKMQLKRCGVRDVKLESNEVTDDSPIWHKSVVKWNISGSILESKGVQIRKTIDHMFEVWRKHLLIEFVEVATKNEADIAISFDDPESRWPHDDTEYAIAFATPPAPSKISLNDNEEWVKRSLRNDTAPDEMAKLILLHVIGHSLGMDHSSSSKSVMYPIFEERHLFELNENNTTPMELPIDDVRTLRQLYDIQDNVVKDDNVATVTSKSTTISESQCPKRISSAMQVGELLFLFHGDKVWKVKGGQVENGPIDIDEIFPEAGAVNVSVSVGNLTFIIHNRTIYGYNYFAAIDTFRIANGWPKVLHDHVLFSPKAVFPLSNGSVVLTSNEAFVTYDLVSNRPISIGDLNRFFPNLPEDLNSGILTQPDSDDILRFFTTDQVVDYNSRIHQTISSQPLAVFVACQ